MAELSQRADARRSYERILEAAEKVISRDGAEASLEEIARTAKVGSATLHRHFTSRWHLLDAVFSDRVDALCTQAADLAVTETAGSALLSWLRLLTTESARNHGLAASMFPGRSGDLLPANSCHVRIHESGQLLLSKAISQGTVRSDVTFTALFALISAIVTFTDGRSSAETENQAMLDLVLDGIRGSH